MLAGEAGVALQHLLVGVQQRAHAAVAVGVDTHPPAAAHHGLHRAGQRVRLPGQGAVEVAVVAVGLLGGAGLQAAVQDELHAPHLQQRVGPVAPVLHAVEEVLDLGRVGHADRGHQRAHPRVQHALLACGLQDGEVGQRHMAVAHGADAGGGEVARGQAQAVDAGGDVGGGQEVLDQVHRVVDQPSVEAPLLVAADHAAGRGGGVLGDAYQAQGQGVDDVVVAAALHQDRVPVAGLVEFGGGGHAPLGEVEFLPVGGGADPLPLGRVHGPPADQVKELGDVVGLVDGHVVGAVAGMDQVSVGVVEGRQHGGAGLVDHGGGLGDPVVQAVRIRRERGDPVTDQRQYPLRLLPGHQSVYGCGPDHGVCASNSHDQLQNRLDGLI